MGQTRQKRRTAAAPPPLPPQQDPAEVAAEVAALRADLPDDEVERITPSELAYWTQVRQQAAQAGQLRAQAEQLEAQATGLEGALDSYCEYLAGRYGLDRIRDLVQDDGTIVRASKTG